MITLSTVTPVYSGQDYLEKLVSGLDQLRLRLGKHSENLRLASSIDRLDRRAPGEVLRYRRAVLRSTVLEPLSLRLPARPPQKRERAAGPAW